MAWPVSLVAPRIRTHLYLVLVLAVVAVPAFDARATAPEPGSAAELLDRAFQNLYAEDYIQTLVLATTSRGGREMRRRLQLTRRQSVRPGKALLRFLYPQSIRHTSVLILENENAADDFYVYLPATRLTRHLSSFQKGDSFFGTDLSYEDIEPKNIENFVVRWIPDDEESQAAGCVRVEITPAPGFDSAYEKQLSCLEVERGVILWTDYYANGRHLKRLVIDLKEVRRVGTRYIPFLITVETPRHRSITKVITEDYELRAEIPDKLFNTWNLVAGDAASDRHKTTAAPGQEPPPAREGASQAPTRADQ